MAKNPIGDIIETAIEQGADPVDALYDFFDECGSAAKISYEQAQYIFDRWEEENE